MRDHTKLKAFGLADQLALKTYELTRTFPSEERYGLSSQMRRAAISIGANIVEGSARPSEVDYARFLSIAYGSAKELQYEISLAARLGYMTQEARKSLEKQALDTSKALWSLIRAIRKNHSGCSL